MSFSVEPVDHPISATVRIPGSKSGTIRALTCAALAVGRSHIYGALDADDPAAMASALRDLGVTVDSSRDPWTVDGTGGHLYSPSHPIVVGESGLTARVLLVVATHAEGSTIIDGVGRLRERPMAGLIDSLIAQDIELTHSSRHLPVTVTGHGGLWGDEISVDCSESSQYATALMLGAPLAANPVRLRLDGLAGSAGYLDLTAEMMRKFGASVDSTFTGYEIANKGYEPADVVVEGDASAAVYPMVAAAITGGSVEIVGVGLDSPQPDVGIAALLNQMGCEVDPTEAGMRVTGPEDGLAPIAADLSGAPDGALALAVACMFATGRSRLDGLFSLRHKESDRLEAMRHEMSKMGTEVEIEDEGLTITPGRLEGARIEPYGDHRIAMSMALAGLKVDGVEVSDEGVVNKTWPGYWEMLSGLD